MVIGLAGSLLAFAADNNGAPIAPSKIKFRADDPMWVEPAPRPVADARFRSIDDAFDFAYHTFHTPGVVKKELRAGDRWPARNINTLGEVPDSNWYTNRHWLHPMTNEELARGPGNQTPPAEGVWRVVAAKSDGVTPGFTIEDAQQRRYLLKFDPPTLPELAASADVIGSKFFFALGYNTPENYIVRFAPDRLQVASDATYRDNSGRKRPLTMRRVRDLLRDQPLDSNGVWRAMASRIIDGKIIGPFRYQGSRTDDPNDIVPHEDRRELRGLALFAAWLNHTDTRAINTLDAIVKEDGRQFIKHHLIDFGAILGSDSIASKMASRGHVFDVDPADAALQIVTLGLRSPQWQRTRTPSIKGVGRFEAASFQPREWLSAYPNPAFMRIDEQDAYWAAKQIARFSDAAIRAVVQTGGYSDTRAADYIAKTLMERRDRIIVAFLRERWAADRFRVTEGRLEFDTPGDDAGQVSVLWSGFENRTQSFEGWAPGDRTIPTAFSTLPEGAFVAAHIIRAPNGGGAAASGAMEVILRKKPGGGWDVAGMERKQSPQR